MSQINISNLTFAYDGSFDNVFENVSFSIDTDWKLGFTGRNGRGKTTFMKLFMGMYEYSGSISSNNTEFTYFPYKISDGSMLVMYIMEEICPDCENWRILKEFSKLGINEEVLYRPFDTLSNGERTKIMISAMFLRENNFMLIDEPTNHLDIEGRILLSRYLNSKKGFILVSHDRDFLDGCIDHILSINRNNIEIQNGNFSSWYSNKQKLDNFEISQNQKLKKDIKRLETASKRNAEWSDKAERSKIGFDPVKTEKSLNRRANEGAKAKKLMSRSKSIQERYTEKIAEKSELLRNIEIEDSLKLSPLKYHSENVVSLHNVSVKYGEKAVCENVSFDIKRGECTALCGKNGCGKSSIIKLICGENIEYTGEIYKGSQLKISYIPQDTGNISGSIAELAVRRHIDESLLKSVLYKLGFERSQLSKDISQLSEGQRKKVLIAASLCTSAHIYIWDEPLNYIDVISRIQLENLIKTYKPTMLFIEHDRAFIQNVCENIINLI